ncbi:adhesion G protein-coupled receptor F4-like [Paramisgurnus dabryanus]|uniref:adhesion G protein-coupled receptor F4-like n=1 Tax=Paramisgurnus dabryanus TaxID=90735 RepID=UPI003CCF019F
MTINQTFDINLTITDAADYKSYKKNIETTINQKYQDCLSNYIKDSVNVTGFRPGSIIADYMISTTSNSINFTSANTQVSDALSNAEIPLAQNAFAVSGKKKMLSNRTEKIYPQESVTLNCPQSVEGPIMWKVNEKDPDSTKYTITNNNRTLIVNSATESDSGRYSCIIQMNSIPFIQWQNIVIERQPSISVGSNERVFPCKERTVQLTCCVNGNYSVEWVPLNDIRQLSGSDCITVDHKIQMDNCKDEIFTCRLKGLKQLNKYSYSMRSVTVKTSIEEFECEDNKLGFGRTNNTTEGLCDIGSEGSKTYTCKSSEWKLTQDNCVLKVIKDLESKAQVLVVGDIPEFMANLSIAAEQNNANITQSAATVQSIVDILFKIADLSKSITINKPVMENFLKTVDIIVSDNSSNTWKNLNNRTTTGNTSSVKLLQAIENISDRLSAVNFTLTQSSIQLIRIQIQNSFNAISQLPNSTTQIVIPNVPESTYITLIVFTKLDNVLPTRNTSNKDSRTSENSINGDVVVVKVDKTISNISFTFDITDTTLKNPQCVFWNFSLDRWDSNGCKVKRSWNETITCECDHTTSFSILMSPFAVDNPALDYITYIGVAISIASLILCLIIEMIVWKSIQRNVTSIQRNDTLYMRHVSIVNIAVSLLIADICFICGAAIPEHEQSSRCSPVVFFMHFFYLAVFFWMFILALLLLYRIVIVLSQLSRVKMMIIAFAVGYCAPLLIAVITVASTAGAGRYIWMRDACWLNWFESKALLAFVIPALTIIAFNLLVLIVVVCTLLRRGVGSQPEMKQTVVVIARCVAILTPIFGLTWGFGIGTMLSPNFGIHVVFAILNSLQGFFVLVFGTLLDKTVRESLSGKLSLKNNSSTRTMSCSQFDSELLLS